MSAIPDFERRQAKYAPVAQRLNELFGWPDWRPFLPPLGLHVSELAWLLTIPVGASWIALITARLSVFGALSRIY